MKIGSFSIQKCAKSSKNGVYHSKFLSSTFGDIFMKIQTKIAKLQMHENLHKNVNENITFLCKFYEFLRRAIKAKNGGPILLDCIKFSQF